MKKNYILPFVLLYFSISTFPVHAQTLLNNMPVPDGHIYALAKSGNTIYMGGFFNNVNSIPHHGLARFDATTGVLDTWNPSIDNNGVNCLAIAGQKLIVGGSFYMMNNQTRIGICMFDLATGSLDPWMDTANFISWRMGIGAYNNLFFYARRASPSEVRIVCVDANTGTFTAWQTDSLIEGDVNAIYASGSYVYVGGRFSLAGGSSVYDNLCRFDQTTGALDINWHPNPSVNNFGVTAIVKTNSEVFVGGDFNTIAGQSREGVAGFDASGALTSFNQNSSSYEVLSLYGDGDFIWVGGNSSSLGGQTRYRIAQIRISSGIATCWNASSTSSTWSTVQAIMVSGDTVYTGPFGNPALAVFNYSPLPLQGTAISGPDAVIPFSSATYTVPLIAGQSYTWTITGGTGTSTTNSILVTWGAGPLGSVSLTQNNPSAGNCSNDTSLQVTISSSVGLNSPRQEKVFSVFPNPASGSFTIANPTGKEIQVSIYDLIGKVILSSKEQGDLIPFNLDVHPGLYSLKIETGEDSFTEKLVIE